MAEQPNAGGSRSYKIRGHSRPRRSTKPYARPNERKKTVLETVKDFFSPSWLVDFFQGNKESPVTEEELGEEDDSEDAGDPGRSELPGSNLRPIPTSRARPQSSRYGIGNGRLGGTFGGTSIQRSASARTTVSGLRHSTVNKTETSTRIDQSSSSMEEDEGSGVRSEDTDVKNQEGDSGSANGSPTPALFSVQGPPRKPVSSLFASTSTPVTGSAAGATPSLTTSSTSLLRSALAAGGKSKEPRYVEPSTRPVFSVAAFGSPLPKPPQSGIIRVQASPFYRGTTSFGGVSSQATSLKRRRTSSPILSEQTNQPERKQIKPTPVSASGTGGFSSQTAKRILEALEGMSSPLTDARKIPSPVFPPSDSPLSFTPSQRRKPPSSSTTIGAPRTLQAHFGAPPVAGMSIPQRAVISRLPAQPPPSRTAATATATTSPGTSFQFLSGSSSIPLYTKPAVPSFTPASLPVSLSPSSQPPKLGGGKMKGPRNTGHYTRNEEEEDGEVVNPLPEVTNTVPLSLPEGMALPSFSFGAKLPSTASSSSISKTDLVHTKSPDITKNNYKFSAPAPKLSASSPPSAKSQDTDANVTFSFSQPCPVTKSSSTGKSPPTNSQLGKLAGPQAEMFSTKLPPVDSWACGSCFVNNKASDNLCIACTSSRPARTSMNASPSNNLISKFAPALGSWTCDTCFVSNKGNDKKCVACQSPRPALQPQPTPLSSKKPGQGSGDLQSKFAASSGSWNCDTCFVENKAADTKCIGCKSSKPGIQAGGRLVASTKSDSDLQIKFAPPSGSWTCDTCMLSNEADKDKCVACETDNPAAKQTSNFKPAPVVPSDSNFTAKFAPASDSWECDTCMLSNKGDVSSCVACETPKPGAKPASFTKNSFQFGVGSGENATSAQLGADSTSSGFKFGGTTESNYSSQGNSSGSGFKFGGPVEKKTSVQSEGTGFSFGGSAETKDSGFKFGGSTASKDPSSSAAGTGFKFGTTSEEPSETKGSKSAGFTFLGGPTESSTKATGLKFGSEKGPPAEAKTSSSTPSKQAGFSFGQSTEPASGFKLGDKSGASGSNNSFVFGSSANNSSVGENKGSQQPGKGVESSSKEMAKPTSIAAAAAVGFLKVPGMVEPTQAGTKSIADAARAGMLKVPTAGEKKGETAPPPNVNLFGGASGVASNNPLAPPVPSALSNVSSADPAPTKPAGSTPSVFGSAVATSVPNSSSTAVAGPPPPNNSAPAANPTVGFSFGAAGSSSTPFSFLAASSAPSQAAGLTSSSTPSSSAVASTPASAAAPFSVGLPSSAPTQAPVPATATSAAGFSFSASSGGANDTKAAAAPFVFGTGQAAFGGGTSVAPSTGNAAPSVGFGSVTTTAAVAITSTAAAPAFGASNSTAAVKPFSFNSSAGGATTAANNSPFSFNLGAGGTSSTTNNNNNNTNNNNTGSSATAKLPGFGNAFNFAPGNAQPAAPGQTFMFGAASQGADETMEADNPASQTGFAAPSSSVFGATSQPAGSGTGGFGGSSAFGSAPANSGGFNFGPAATTPSAGFQFGAQASSGSGGFAFGSNSSAPAFGAPSAPQAASSSSGFNFQASAGGGLGGQSFNFGASGKPPGFVGNSGDASSGVALPRKFKRAVRRKPR